MTDPTPRRSLYVLIREGERTRDGRVVDLVEWDAERLPMPVYSLGDDQRRLGSIVSLARLGPPHREIVAEVAWNASGDRPAALFADLAPGSSHTIDLGDPRDAADAGQTIYLTGLAVIGAHAGPADLWPWGP